MGMSLADGDLAKAKLPKAPSLGALGDATDHTLLACDDGYWFNTEYGASVIYPYYVVSGRSTSLSIVRCGPLN